MIATTDAIVSMPRVLIFGAHPDDVEVHAGGLCALWRQAAATVKIVTVTNGDAGHFAMFGEELARRRHDEAHEAARLLGAELEIWDNHDGCLEPTLENRWRVIRAMREFRPDLVLTHRTHDYHPDHRAVGHLVRDASYLVTVPGVVREVEVLSRPPVIGYMSDHFTKPTPLSADVIVDTTAVIDQVVASVACHRSQFLEWLPYNWGVLDQVPREAEAARVWLREWVLGRLRRWADRYRAELVATYGEERGRAVEFAEPIEISEYAAPLDAAAKGRLFPFLPEK